MENKHFLKAEMRCQGSIAGEVFIDIGSIIVMETTTNGIRVKLSNAGEDYYVKEFYRYTIDDVLDLYRRNVRRNVKNQNRKDNVLGGFVL